MGKHCPQETKTALKKIAQGLGIYKGDEPSVSGLIALMAENEEEVVAALRPLVDRKK